MHYAYSLVNNILKTKISDVGLIVFDTENLESSPDIHGRGSRLHFIGVEEGTRHHGHRPQLF